MRDSSISTAVIGTGFIGTVHIGALRHLGVPVVGELGLSLERGAAQAKALRVACTYPSLTELQADPAVQVVHVTSPNVAHCGQAQQILGAGRHVICEKRLAVPSRQSAEIAALAQASGLVAAS